MKKIAFLLVLILAVSYSTILGQVTDGITYQAVALDDKGKEIAGHDINGLIIHNKEIGVRFSILSSTSEGEILYMEEHSTNTDQHGLFTLVIGHGAVSSEGLYQNLTDINWGADILFLKVEIDLRNRGVFKVMGIQQMMAVPFAFHALSSSNTSQIDYTDISNAPSFSVIATSGYFNDLLNIPTSLSGYGITDAMSTSHAANAITGVDITNWNSAFTWGDHTGLYRPIGWVPDWSEITSRPFLFTSPVDEQLIRYNAVSGNWENWTPDYLTGFTELDPVWTAASANYYTIAEMQTSGTVNLHFDNLTNMPTSLAGYGITDAMNTSHAANAITGSDITNWNSAFTWGDHTGLYRPIGWVPDWSEITSRPFLFTSPVDAQLIRYNAVSGNWENWTPDYLTGFTELDPVWTAASANYYTIADMQTSGTVNLHFDNLTNMPTSLAGYGITDAMSTSHAANAITGSDITNWNSAFTWGDHTGLYRPIGYVPDWSEITSRPFLFTSPVDEQLIRYNSTSGNWENWTPNYLTGYTETDPDFHAWDRNSGITITESQISDLQHYLFSEVDGSVTNEIQNLSDVISIGNSANGQIKNLFDPTEPQDAATKAYVDSIMPTLNTSGQMMYWDGNDWLIIEPGLKGQVLTFCDGFPIWGPCPYTVAVDVFPLDGGTATGPEYVNEGENVTVSAVPAAGYGFKYWEEGAAIVSADADYTFSMPANDVSLTAHFGTEVIDLLTYTANGVVDIPFACFEIEYLIVAGGGSGGAVWSDNNGFAYSAGAGGGGMLDGIITDPLPGTNNVVVGAGGTSTTLTGNNGGNSSFYGIETAGGGGGGYGIRDLGGNPYISGKNGGSGGGAGGTASVRGTRGVGVVGQGYNGGAGIGGGGGAGGAGSQSWTGGNGGIGRASSISGSSVLYAPGGRGGNGSAGAGSNYGRGGNGGRSYSGTVNGGAGFSGIVILRVKYYD